LKSWKATNDNSEHIHINTLNFNNEQIEQTVSLIEELDADRTHLNLVVTLPGTELTKYSDGLSKEWWRYYFHGKTLHTISDVDSVELDKLFRKICEWAALRNKGVKEKFNVESRRINRF
jgi:hypothetical protein